VELEIAFKSQKLELLLEEGRNMSIVKTRQYRNPDKHYGFFEHMFNHRNSNGYSRLKGSAKNFF